MGNVTGLALAAGIQEGDILLSIDGTDTPTLTQVVPPLMLAAIDRRDIEIVLQDRAGEQRKTILRLSQLPADFDQTRVPQIVGLKMSSIIPAPIVGILVADGAAFGRLQLGDRITKVGAIEIKDYTELSPAIAKQAKPDQALSILFERQGEPQQVMIQPKLVTAELGLWGKIKTFFGFEATKAKPVWQIGVGPVSVTPKQTLLRFGPIDSVGKAFEQTWETTRNTFSMLKRLVTGKASVKNVSGTITVAQVANQEASTSLGSFLGFLAFFSLSLCIMNLLPIPVLDGGHLLYYAIELVTGHPVAERVQMAGQFIGLTLLAGLMLLAHYNDFARLFSN